MSDLLTFLFSLSPARVFPMTIVLFARPVRSTSSDGVYPSAVSEKCVTIGLELDCFMTTTSITHDWSLVVVL